MVANIAHIEVGAIRGDAIRTIEASRRAGNSSTSSKGGDFTCQIEISPLDGATHLDFQGVAGMDYL